MPFLFLTMKGSAQDKAFFTWERVTICESFQGQTSRVQPAFLTISAPKGQRSTYILSAAFGYNVAWDAVSQFLELNIVGEYKRNNQIKKEQHIYLAGIAADWTLLDIVEKKWTPLILSKVNYKNNAVDASNSFQANILLSPLFVGNKKNPAIPNLIHDFGFVKTLYIFYIGCEYEKVFSAKEPTGIKGETTRGLIRFQISLLPLPHLLDEKLELLTEYTYRHDFSDNIDPLDNDHTLFKESANIILYKSDNGKHAVSIGLDYSLGDDPSNAIKDQNVVKITFKGKF